jgi:hypothetical protein
VIKRDLKGFELAKGLVIVAIVALLAFGSWRLWDHHNQVARQKQAAKGWIQYKSLAYGLKFSYPKDWGTPTVSHIEEQNGRNYIISFRTSHSSATRNPTIPATGVKPAFNMAFESEGVIHTVCPSNGSSCITSHAFTKSELQKALSGDKTKFLKYDSTSYSVLLSDSKSGLASGLNFYQIVNLPRLSVSAVRAVYYNIGNTSTKCPIDRLSPDSSKDCITESIYNKVARTVSSIHSL